MEFTIKQSYGHYELYVNGQFYGSYDSPTEAAYDIDHVILKGENQNGSI